MTQTFVSNTYTSDTTITIPSNAANVRIIIQAGYGGQGGWDDYGGSPGGGGAAGRYGDLTFNQNWVGRNHSEETKIKMRESARKRWGSKKQNII
jgi:hypothetical protein